MPSTPGAAPDRLARQLVLDEIFDVSLYRALRRVAKGDLVRMLDELIGVETRHVAFWQEFFGLESLQTLDLGRRLKLGVLRGACRLFGASAINVVLEAIEVHGVRKYLRVWEHYKDGPLGTAVRGILDDEFRHEDMIVTGDAERRVNPDTVRNIFLGLNDGLVEILGAVSGFFAAFGSSAAVVGLAYAAGAMVPVLPVLFGAGSMLPTVLSAGATIVVVSAIVAFLSGMDVRRRIGLNLVITAMAVVVTYSIGLVAKAAWGVSV